MSPLWVTSVEGKTMNSKKIEIPSDPKAKLMVEKALLEALKEHSYGEQDVFAVRLATEEAVVNAIRHGNDLDPQKKVVVSFSVTDGKVTVVVSDQGEGFDPAIVPDPTDPRFLEVPSGRGLMLMRAYMDEVLFNEKGNEVTMIKTRSE
jgi:serine/threonine-protein kinase RsbW